MTMCVKSHFSDILYTDLNKTNIRFFFFLQNTIGFPLYRKVKMLRTEYNTTEPKMNAEY